MDGPLEEALTVLPIPTAVPTPIAFAAPFKGTLPGPVGGTARFTVPAGTGAAATVGISPRTLR